MNAMDDEGRPVEPVESSERAAPAFELLDDQGRFARLADFRGDRSVVLYFARSFG